MVKFALNVKIPGQTGSQRKLFSAMEKGMSGAEGDRAHRRTAFDRATGKILGKLAMPFSGLGGHGTVGGSPLFCCTTQIETLVRLHCLLPRTHFGGS